MLDDSLAGGGVERGLGLSGCCEGEQVGSDDHAIADDVGADDGQIPVGVLGPDGFDFHGRGLDALAG